MGSKSLVRLKYDATAGGYDELYREEQRSKYAAALRGTYHLLLGGPQLTVLDDGCGTALLLEYLCEILACERAPLSYYVCLDISRGMLEVSRGRIQDLGLGHVADLVEADAENLPLRTASVHVVFAFTVFDLLEDPGRGAGEALRVAKRAVVYSLLVKAGGRRQLVPGARLVGATDKDVVYVVVREPRALLEQPP